MHIKIMKQHISDLCIQTQRPVVVNRLDAALALIILLIFAAFTFRCTNSTDLLVRVGTRQR